MRLRTLVWKELRARPSAMLTCGLAIVLGVAALVAIRSVTDASEAAVARKMESLGANVLLLPKSAGLQDYYAADMHGQTLREEDATRLALANLEGVESLSPKLCVSVPIKGRDVTLTGILPQSEFQAKAAWQSATLFTRKHTGCQKACSTREPATADSFATRRIIQELKDDEVLVGADIAEFSNIKPGAKVDILGKPMRVLAVLPSTGTVDDGRVFAHLHTVQDLAKTGEVVNSIEIMACCEDAAGGLIPRLKEMFPEARVATISHIVEAQVSVNRLMSRLSFIAFAVLVLVGAATMAGAMYANVRERWREIGTLMALGATPRVIAGMFLLKAAGVGIVGGLLGCALGMGTALWIGPNWAGIDVSPSPGLALLMMAAAPAVTLLASLLPARRAALLDPCTCFQEA